MSFFQYNGRSVFYQEYGTGRPLIFLHGNTASSKLFELLMPLYMESFRCILIDFLGNGHSERVKQFSPDLWQEEALQTIALIQHLQCEKADLVGTSGGAWAAVNAALERPDLFHAVVADSFDGRTLQEGFAAKLLSEREAAKANAEARQFYEWCQGPDWETVIDLDTQALLRCAAEQRPLFCKPLEELKVPVLLMGSKADEQCRENLAQEYKEMAALIPRAVIRLFDQGGHPAILTNGEQAAEIIRSFLLSACPQGDQIKTVVPERVF